MSKKTWIKIKRGMLKPDHRVALGIRVWLFMYMIDICEWPTGTIPEWIDKSAADELGMPVNTIRKQRRKLDEDEYISCIQGQHSQHITIHKWTDPRKYSGEVLNIEETPDVGVSKDAHPEVSKDDHPEENEFEGDHQGDHQVIQQMVTLPIESQNTDHISENDQHSQGLWNQVLRAIGLTYYPQQMNLRSSAYSQYWLPTIYGAQVDNAHVIMCATVDQRDWLRDRGTKIAEKTLTAVLGVRSEVRFEVGS